MRSRGSADNLRAMTEDTRRHALSFGPAATEYDRFRPSYPVDAVRWALGLSTGGARPSPESPQPRPESSSPAPGSTAPPSPTVTGGPLRVVDLGAGTGLLTRVLLRLGQHVVPVEPDEQMRAQLARATPGTTALAGSAERIPLPDADADAVVVGQAYHWFDPPRAHTEVARVLRPGGLFAVLRNERDESVAWVAALSELGDRILGPQGITKDGRALASFGAHFGPVERAEFHHRTRHTADTLVGMVATRSYYLTAGPELQREMTEAVRDLAATHPDLAGRDSFELPYRTQVFRARRG